MDNLKCRVQPQLIAHISVHYLKEVVFFESEIDGYKTV